MKQSKDIRAVFLDLDGTLLRGADTISERNLRALRRIQERGVIPVIATGRPAGETDFAVRATGADRYLIVMNGLAVYEDYRTRTLLHEAHLSDEAVELIIPWLLEQHIFFEAYIGERSVCQRSAAEWIQTCGMSEDQIRFFRTIIEPVDDLMAYIRSGHRVNKIFFSTTDTGGRRRITTRSPVSTAIFWTVKPSILTWRHKSSIILNKEISTSCAEECLICRSAGPAAGCFYLRYPASTTR